MNLEFWRHLSELQHVSSYEIWLLVIGLGILAITLLPRVLAKHPLSVPMVLLSLGFVVMLLPVGLVVPNPLKDGLLTERATELGVIVSLMGAGLKIDRRFSLKGWASTWRLITTTMILTIFLAAFLGWWIGALAPAAALLFGAAIAPTDPVLATDVQVAAPFQGSLESDTDEDPPQSTALEDIVPEDEIRFALTSEAGLNDGLAFPFTHLAVAVALWGLDPRPWFGSWLLFAVFYKIVVGVVCGYILGRLLGKTLLSVQAKSDLSKTMLGLGALASTFIVYALTQAADGYGFIAVFVAAITIRSQDRGHERHSYLFYLSEKSERLMTVGILIALGGAIADGLLAALNFRLIIVAFLTVFFVRPLTGILGLVGLKDTTWAERSAIAFFGIRGVGSLYYLSYGLNRASIPGAEQLWALCALIIVVSIFVHGATASWVMARIDRQSHLIGPGLGLYQKPSTSD